jgi:hypothetical protein
MLKIFFFLLFSTAAFADLLMIDPRTTSPYRKDYIIYSDENANVWRQTCSTLNKIITHRDQCDGGFEVMMGSLLDLTPATNQKTPFIKKQDLGGVISKNVESIINEYEQNYLLEINPLESLFPVALTGTDANKDADSFKFGTCTFKKSNASYQLYKKNKMLIKTVHPLVGICFNKKIYSMRECVSYAAALNDCSPLLRSTKKDSVVKVPAPVNINNSFRSSGKNVKEVNMGESKDLPNVKPE